MFDSPPRHKVIYFPIHMDDQERAKELGAKRRQGTLTPEEKLELLQIANREAEELKKYIRQSISTE